MTRFGQQWINENILVDVVKVLLRLLLGALSSVYNNPQTVSVLTDDFFLTFVFAMGTAA